MNAIALNLLGAIVILFSCTDNNAHLNNNQVSLLVYTDIPSFVAKQIDSLQKANPTIEKTVTKDSIAEHKSLKIKDWNNELSSFLSIDLNKPAYVGSIQKDSSNYRVRYIFTNKELDLDSVILQYNENNLESVTISKKSNNLLYKTKENLFFQKGKEYKVEKTQEVKFLGTNTYSIHGIIK